MQVARVISPVSSRESWTVLGEDDAPVAPVERYLAYLSDIERSPNTGGTVSPGARERIGATARACPAPSPRSLGGPMTGIAAEISELAEVLGKLGVLRDSGILTDKEFNEQKQRLLVR